MAAQNEPRSSRIAPTAFARLYFAVQAIAGALWWLAVSISADVREWTRAARFGTQYDDYRRSVRRWIPAASSIRRGQP